MREYTVRERKLLKANPYTYRITKNKLYFTVEFKQAFWTGYQAGLSPRKLLTDLGYDLKLFGQKQIDNITRSIKDQALSGNGFHEGENRERRPVKVMADEVPDTARVWAEVKYLRQEVEFLKKIMQGGDIRRGLNL